jgi:hypothetical protein
MRHIQISRATAVVVMSTALSLGILVPASATGNVSLSPYAPFPRAALTAVGASFVRPTNAQAISARVSVPRAYSVALAQAGKLSKGTKVTMRLGLFRDAMQGKSAALSYAVTFDGVDIPSYGPTPGPGGHELVVIVNANSGRSVEAFSYR